MAVFTLFLLSLAVVGLLLSSSPVSAFTTGPSFHHSNMMRLKPSSRFSNTLYSAATRSKLQPLSCMHMSTSMASFGCQNTPSSYHGSSVSTATPSSTRLQSTASPSASTSTEPNPEKSPEPKLSSVKSQPTKTLKKLLPLGAMLFFILFNYTILRDTKDVLVVTAPNSGAEIIPFLKTYVNLPSALGFTVLYSYLCNKMSNEKVFYVLLSSFLAFFGAFAGFICE